MTDNGNRNQQTGTAQYKCARQGGGGGGTEAAVVQLIQLWSQFGIAAE